MMTEPERVLYRSLHSLVKFRRPTAVQRRLTSDRSTHRLLCAGRRSGKTVCAANLAGLALLAGQRILYGTPVAKQARIFFNEVLLVLGPLIVLGKYKVNHGLRLIEAVGVRMADGGVPSIEAQTCHVPDNLRSAYYDLIILDEFQGMKFRTWSEVCAPMLMDRGGKILMILTPRRDSTTATVEDLIATRDLCYKAEAGENEFTYHHFRSHDNVENLYRDVYVEGEDGKTRPITHDEKIERISAQAPGIPSVAYQQEIEARWIEEAEEALFTLATLEASRVPTVADVKFDNIVIGVDPPGGRTECGIVAAGRGTDGHFYILEDNSKRAKPSEWAAAVIQIANRWGASKIVAEGNYGGDMVENTIESTGAAPPCPVEIVHAGTNKASRATPMAAAFGSMRAHLLGQQPHLETELTLWVPTSTDSPNRMDAAAHAYRALFVEDTGESWLDYYREE